MSRVRVGRVLGIFSLGVLLIASQRSRADADVADEAKQSQNPIADLISVPFQNNTNLNAGPERGTLNVLNVQPVVPVSLSSDWNVITRTILPVISEPPLSPDGSRINGIGDVLFSAFFSPRASNGWIWGAGPAVQVPTHSNAVFGNNNWGAGPTFVFRGTTTWRDPLKVPTGKFARRYSSSSPSRWEHSTGVGYRDFEGER
jgi:hypothetical protein